MIIRKDQATVDQGTEERAEEYGPTQTLHLSDAGGLTRFGAHVQTLRPGSRSSDRHWHEQEDEFLYMDEFLYIISGEATVVEEDGVHPLRPGDAACWPAGGVSSGRPTRRTPGRRPSPTPCSPFAPTRRRGRPSCGCSPPRSKSSFDGS